MPDGFWDDIGSFASSAGGWLGDVVGVATSVSNNIAQLQSSLNAVKKPKPGPMAAPVGPYLPGPMGPDYTPGVPPLLLFGGLALGLWLIVRK